MQINLNTITLTTLCLILSACSDSKTQNPEVTAPKPKAKTPSQIAPNFTTVSHAQKTKKAPQIGTYEATMQNPALGRTQPLHLKLQEGNLFTAYPNHEPNNKTRGNWKVEGNFLICTGTTEHTKQIMKLTIDSTSMELISISQKINGKETEMFLKQFIPTGANNITFTKKPNP